MIKSEFPLEKTTLSLTNSKNQSVEKNQKNFENRKTKGNKNFRMKIHTQICLT